jgi:hypothetical protein
MDRVINRPGIFDAQLTGMTGHGHRHGTDAAYSDLLRKFTTLAFDKQSEIG